MPIYIAFLKKNWLPVVIAILVLVSPIPAITAPPNSLVNWYTTDDAFYYFKVAENVAEGNGFTFDRLGADSGFHPLWLFISIPFFALAQIDRILPLRLLIGFLAILNATSAILLYFFLRRVIPNLLAGFMAVVWAFTPIIHAITTRNGMESGLVIVLLLIMLNLVARYDAFPPERKTAKPLIWIGIVAGMLVLARLDNVFLVGLMGLWFVFRSPRVRILLMLDALFISTAVFLAYYLRLTPGIEFYQNSGSLYVMLASALVFRVTANYLLGLYQHTRQYSVWSFLLRLVISSAAGTVLISGVLFVGQAIHLYAGFPRTVLLLEAAISIIWLTTSRFVLRFTQAPIDEPSISVLSEIRKRFLPLFLRGLAYALPVSAIVGTYMLWMKRTFGVFSPVSGLIKRWWGSLPNTVYGKPVDSLEGVFGWQEKGFGPWSLVVDPINNLAKAGSKIVGNSWQLPLILIIFAILAALSLWAVIGNKNFIKQKLMVLCIVPLFSASWIHLFSYTATSYVHMRMWYWLVQMMLIVLAASLLLGAVFERLKDIPWLRLLAAIVLGLGAIEIVVRFEVLLIRLVPPQVAEANSRSYLSTIDKLESLTPPGARIGATGGGVTSYFITDRTIVNMDGLMNTAEYFTALKAGTGREYLDNLGLDYVFANAYVVNNSDPYFQLLADRLVIIQDITGWEPGTLFRYIIP